MSLVLVIAFVTKLYLIVYWNEGLLCDINWTNYHNADNQNSYNYYNSITRGKLDTNSCE